MVYPDATPASSAPGDVPPGYEIKTLSDEGRNGQELTEELFVKRIPRDDRRDDLEFVRAA